ncbi:MAG: TlpA family protein disulfide reductase [Xanthobacteraceae bacterium]|nr:MAG: TlpA family protein disulfide reductase [Xanthobacteraceae bacterium]
MTPDPTPRQSHPPAPAPAGSRRAGLAVAAVAAAAALGFAGIYGIGGLKRNADGAAACRPAVETARRIAPLVRGEVAALTPAAAPLAIPDLAFHDADGRPRSLTEWRGRTVLLNLWTTWCVPCRKEMPALDALQTKLGGERFEVVAVNIDTRDPDKPKAWLQETGVTRLRYFSDNKARIFQDLKAIGRAPGMPTSILIDGAGCEIAMLAGPAEWASDDALRVIGAVLAP